MKEHDVSISEDLKEPLIALSVFKGSFDAYAAAAILNLNYDSTCDVLGILTNQAVIEYNPMTERYIECDFQCQYLYKNFVSNNSVSCTNLLHFVFCFKMY